MILRNATIKYKGYDPDILTKGSEKRVCCSCDGCGRVRYRSYNNYNRTGDLCKSCSSKGKLNGMYNQKHSNETIEKMSESHTGIKRKPFTNEHKKNLSKNHHDVSGKLNPAWIGGYVKDRSHLLSKNQCVKINQKFIGSEGHHITSDVIVYIPKELHNHIRHSLKTNKNMNIINLLSLQYLKGNL